MGNLVLQQTQLFTGATATGSSVAVLVENFQHILATLSSSWSANFTIKFQWSMQLDRPDFSAPQSSTNTWDYIQVKDYQNNASIDGDTGIAFAGTDDVRIVELNTNNLRWVGATITARIAGSINLFIVWSDNQ